MFSLTDVLALKDEIQDMIERINDDPNGFWDLFYNKARQVTDKNSFDLGIVTQTPSGLPVITLYVFEVEVDLRSTTVLFVKHNEHKFRITVSYKRMVANRRIYNMLKPTLDRRMRSRFDTYITDIFPDSPDYGDSYDYDDGFYADGYDYSEGSHSTQESSDSSESTADSSESTESSDSSSDDSSGFRFWAQKPMSSQKIPVQQI